MSRLSSSLGTAVALALGVAACGPSAWVPPERTPWPGADPCDEFPFWQDIDGDGIGDGEPVYACEPPEGYVLRAGDCDDEDPTRHPGADELCDGLDTDCDGQLPADEADGDGDGSSVCFDCDDDDPDRSPGFWEWCDGVDNDCDGEPNHYGPGGELDDDGDGQAECEGDCDDTDPAILDDGQESCDGVDDDCDFVVDEGCTGCGELVHEFVPGGGGVTALEMLSTAQGLYALLDFPDEGRALWRYHDGVAEEITPLQSDIDAGALTEFAGAVVFVGAQPETPPQLFRVDGDALTSIAPAVVVDDGADLVIWDGAVYFPSRSGPWNESLLARYDGAQVESLAPVDFDYFNGHRNLAVYDDAVYMRGNNPETNGWDLYRWDGATLTNVSVESGAPASIEPTEPAVADGLLFFRGNLNGGVGGIRYLLRYDGSTIDDPLLPPGPNSGAIRSPYGMTTIGDRVYFRAGDFQPGLLSIDSDGWDLEATVSVTPGTLVQWNGELWMGGFSSLSSTPDPDTELYSVSATGFQQKHDLMPGAGSSHPHALVVHEERLHFVGNTGDGAGAELRRCDPDA